MPDSACAPKPAQIRLSQNSGKARRSLTEKRRKTGTHDFPKDGQGRFGAAQAGADERRIPTEGEKENGEDGDFPNKHGGSRTVYAEIQKHTEDIEERGSPKWSRQHRMPYWEASFPAHEEGC